MLGKWTEDKSASYNNHPFYTCKNVDAQWYLTIEKNGELDIQVATNDCDFYDMKIPHSVVQALLTAYAKR